MAKSSDYPNEWSMVAKATKDAANWRCIRCGHPHEQSSGRLRCDGKCDATRHLGGLNDDRQRILTVHHLNGRKGDLRWWNLVALCQVCHLIIQAKIVIERMWIFEHSEWFKPYAAGWYAWRYEQHEISRNEAMKRMDELLSLERLL